MKSTMLTLLFAISTLANIYAQKASLTFFSQEGERFYVILNGIRQNDKPSANVKVTDLGLPNYKSKIIFENPALGSIDKALFVQDADGKFADLVYNIRKDKKGAYIMRISGFSEVATAAPASQQTNVIAYHAEETPAPAQPAVVAPVTVKQTTTTTTTTKPTNTTTYQENVNMNLGGLGFGVNVDSTVTEDADGNIQMNVNTGGLNTNTSVKQTTTTTTTTTTTKTINPAIGQPTPAPTPAPSVSSQVKQAGCVNAISSTDFAAGKKSISGQSFSDSQLKTAKTFTKNNCLSVAQIKEIVDIFSFEASKLDYAKYAYDFCVDKKNYYQLTESFSFSSSADELNEFLETK
jgi:hypothetical protein